MKGDSPVSLPQMSPIFGKHVLPKVKFEPILLEEGGVRSYKMETFTTGTKVRTLDRPKTLTFMPQPAFMSLPVPVGEPTNTTPVPVEAKPKETSVEIHV